MLLRCSFSITNYGCTCFWKMFWFYIKLISCCYWLEFAWFSNILDFTELIISCFDTVSSKASDSLRLIYWTFLFIPVGTIFNHLCRLSVTPRAEPSSSLSCYNLKFTICGQAQNRRIRRKFPKVSENFREATLKCQL